MKFFLIFFLQPPHAQDVSRRVQSVAEQQAKVRAIREVHEREQQILLREQQELAQERQQQQHLVRGEKCIIPLEGRV